MDLRHQRGAAKNDQVGVVEVVRQIGLGQLAGRTDGVEECALPAPVVVARIGKHLRARRASARRHQSIGAQGRARQLLSQHDAFVVRADGADKAHREALGVENLRGVNQRDDGRTAHIDRVDRFAGGDFPDRQVRIATGKLRELLAEGQLAGRQAAIAVNLRTVPREGISAEVDLPVDVVEQAAADARNGEARPIRCLRAHQRIFSA